MIGLLNFRPPGGTSRLLDCSQILLKTLASYVKTYDHIIFCYM
uniref:Uncharacterized protein n=1 Tax=Rhizophora mucronata TaxID=61149 RepID=A0A2P2J1H1_RHIMU